MFKKLAILYALINACCSVNEINYNLFSVFQRVISEIQIYFFFLMLFETTLCFFVIRQNLAKYIVIYCNDRRRLTEVFTFHRNKNNYKLGIFPKIMYRKSVHWYCLLQYFTNTIIIIGVCLNSGLTSGVLLLCKQLVYT